MPMLHTHQMGYCVTHRCTPPQHRSGMEHAFYLSGLGSTRPKPRDAALSVYLFTDSERSEGSHAPRQAASSDPSRETTDPDPLITADSMQSRRARSMRCFASLIGCEKIVGYALASVAFHSERSEESVPGTKGAARAADPSLRSG